MKSYKKTVIITTLITLCPILIGLILWNRLPDTMATHWGADGQPDGWSDKIYAVFAMPCIMAAINLAASVLILNDPKRKNIHRKPLVLVLWAIPVISVLCCSLTYMAALGFKIKMEIIVSVLVGLFFIVVGNYMPKLQQNYTIGIKVPWTLSSEENWNRTHRLGGKTFIAGGVLLMAAGVAGGLLNDTFMIAAIIGIILFCAGIPTVYSFWLFKKGI